MNRTGRRKRLRAFTLVELLVVIAIIGILAALLFPAVSGAMLKSKGAKVGSDGRQIALGLYSEDIDRDAAGYRSIYPDDSYSESTDFFRDCIESNWLSGFSFSMLAAPGVPACTSTNIADFKNQNNAWILVENVGTTIDGCPLLLTRNFCKAGGAAVADGDMLNTIVELDPNAMPFGDKLAVVISKGSSVKIILRKFLRTADDSAWDATKFRELAFPVGQDKTVTPPGPDE